MYVPGLKYRATNTFFQSNGVETKCQLAALLHLCQHKNFIICRQLLLLLYSVICSCLLPSCVFKRTCVTANPCGKEQCTYPASQLINSLLSYLKNLSMRAELLITDRISCLDTVRCLVDRWLFSFVQCRLPALNLIISSHNSLHVLFSRKLCQTNI